MHFVIEAYGLYHSWRYCRSGKLASPFRELEPVCVKGGGAMRLKIFGPACP